MRAGTRGLCVVLSLVGALRSQLTRELRQRHAEALQAGVAEYEAGRFESALAHFQRAHEADPSHEGTAHYLAGAHAKLAGAAFRARDFGRAARHYLAADRLWPDQVAVLRGLARVRFEERSDPEAEKLLLRVLEREPGDVDARILLGMLAERNDRQDRARDWFAQAAELAPGRPDLERKADKLARVAAAETGFTTLEVGPFRIQYHPANRVARGLLGLAQTSLRTAHAELEREFGAAPKLPIAVQLYTLEEYAKVRENPLAAACFDGKLRIPVRDGNEGKEELASNLRHELTHAFLFALFPAAPPWLHEGHAQVVERRSLDGARSRMRAKEAWLAAERFESEFATTRDGELMRRGYDQALLVVSWLKRDPRRYAELLEAFATGGTDSNRAVKQVYGCTFAELVERARRAL